MTKDHEKDTENQEEVEIPAADGMISLFGDGFGPLLLGYPNSKITIVQHSIKVPTGSVDERELVATITVPTVALIDLANHVERAISRSKDQMSKEYESQINKILSFSKNES